MADLIYVAIIVAFFGLATLFISACDRIVGGDVAARSDEATQANVDAEVTA